MPATPVLERQSTKLVYASAILANRPVMLWGEPATGKTSLVKALAQEIDAELILLIGSTMDPTDISGLPSSAPAGRKDENGEDVYKTVLNPSYWQNLVMSNPGKKFILFFDEFSNILPSTRSALLTLIQDGIFPNGEHLHANVRIIAATNAVEHSENGSKLSEATNNRFMHIHWDPPAREWIDWMRNDVEGLSDNEVYWRRRIASFIEDEPTFMHKPPKAQDKNSKRGGSATERAVMNSAWPSRRSWDNAAKVLSFLDKKNDHDFVDAAVRGWVGPEASISFSEWRASHSDGVQLSEAMNDPDSVDWGNIELNNIQIIARESKRLLGQDDTSPEDVHKVVKMLISAADHNRCAPFGGSYNDIIALARTRLAGPRGAGPEKTHPEIWKDVISMATKFAGVSKHTASMER